MCGECSVEKNSLHHRADVIVYKHHHLYHHFPSNVFAHAESSDIFEQTLYHIVHTHADVHQCATSCNGSLPLSLNGMIYHNKCSCEAFHFYESASALAVDYFE